MSKEIVVPGEMVSAEPKQLGSHTFMVDQKVYADVLGLKSESEDRISVVPLHGKYIPIENDVIIGVVKNEKFAGYDIEINSFYPSFVSKQELREPLRVGSIVSAKIIKVNELNEADVGMVRSLRDGEIVAVTPVKVPRIIGKNASMLNVIKNGTGSTVMVGRNGLVWVAGGNASLAVETILRIEEYSHVENLTNDIQRFLAAKTGQGMPDTRGPSNESSFESGFESGGRGYGGDRGGFRGRGGGFGGQGHDRGRFGGGDRGSFRPRTRGFGGDRPMRYRGNRGGFGGPRNNFSSNRGFRDSDREQGGFHPNNRFGRQYDSPSPGRDGFDRRKRFPRDNTRVRGDEDPSFE